MNKQRIGFVGVGLMGHGMAGNLLKAGYDLAVIAHSNRVPVDDLVEKGAREVMSFAEMARATDCIFMCVSNSSVVEQVIDELLPYLRQSQLIIDASTADPSSTKNVASQLAEKGVAFADAPLTGGPDQAAAGVLGAMVGADEDTFRRAEPILSAFCSRVVHFGPPGTGHGAKLINNYLVMAMVAAITDTYRVARRTDVDWVKLFEVMKCGSNYSEALRRIVEPALEGDFGGYKFTVDNALKDMSYYNKFADSHDVASDLACNVEAFFKAAVEQGHGDLLLSHLIDPASGDSNAEVK